MTTQKIYKSSASVAHERANTRADSLDWERICDLDYWHKRLSRQFGRKRIHHKPFRADKDTQSLV